MEVEDSTAAAETATRQEPPSAKMAQHSLSPSTAPPSKPTPSAAAESKPTNNASVNIEFEPPAACVRRLLKSALPKSTNVSRDSLAAISRASGIFVLYLTACANDVAREGRRTTIVAKDVLGALKELDFGDFVPLMEKFLEGHRKEEGRKKEEKERLKKLQVEKQQVHKDEKGGTEGRDATTGKFVTKDGKQGDGEDGGDKVEGEEAKRLREGGERDDPSSAKKQKVGEGDHDD